MSWFTWDCTNVQPIDSIYSKNSFSVGLVIGSFRLCTTIPCSVPIVAYDWLTTMTWKIDWWRHKDDHRAALAVKFWNNYISSSVSPSTPISWMSNDKSYVIQLNCKQCLKFITRFEFYVYWVIVVFVPTRIDTWSSNVDTWSHLSRLLVCFLEIGILSTLWTT